MTDKAPERIFLPPADQVPFEDWNLLSEKLDGYDTEYVRKDLAPAVKQEWQPIETAPDYNHSRPILCRNENHWPEICYVKGGMAFDHRGYAMVGYVPVEWNATIGRLNWLNAPLPNPPEEDQ